MLTHLNTAVWLTVQHLETTLLVFIHSSFARLVEPLYGHVFQLKEVLQTPASSFLLRDSYRLPNYLHISVFIYLHYVTAITSDCLSAGAENYSYKRRHKFMGYMLIDRNLSYRVYVVESVLHSLSADQLQPFANISV